jgi:hypothetical protein
LDIHVPYILTAYAAITFGGILAGYSEDLEEIGFSFVTGGLVVIGVSVINLSWPFEPYWSKVAGKFFVWFTSSLVAMFAGLFLSNLLPQPSRKESTATCP